MFFVLGLAIVLAVMLVLNALASVFAGLVWSVGRKRVSNWSAAATAQALFLLRTLPVGFGITCILLLFAPAYLAHEPRDGHEDVSAKLALLAGFSAIGISLALIRGIAAWRSTSRLAADWLQHSKRIQLPKLSIPCYQIEHKFPLIAVVGVLRPKLFIARQVFETLTPEELHAALDHEAGHIVARDNLRRGLMRACRDVLLIVPFGRSMDQAWMEASEAAADEFAARSGRKTGLDLASAMVKIARMIPAGARPTMTAGAFLIGDETKISLKNRVRRLVQSANAAENAGNSRANFTAIVKWVPVGLTLLAAAIIANEPHVLAYVHEMIEHTVHVLS